MDIPILRQRQEILIKNEQYAKERCFYCGAELKECEKNNAEDYGLHYETAGKACCNSCNALVTNTNRYLSLTINNNDTPKENYIMMAINNLQSILDTIKAEKQ